MKLRIFRLLAVLFFIIYFLYFMIEFLFIPESINVTSGEKYVINLNSPFKATITPESIETLYINNKKVDDNINVDLKDNITMTGDKGIGKISIKFLGMPLKNISLNMNEARSICPIGKAVGICVNTKGVLVLGTGKVRGYDGKEYEPAKDVLKVGDIITKVNNIEIKTNEELVDVVGLSSEKIKVEYIRENNYYSADIDIVKSDDNGKNKVGLWVRDSTQGIGTVTYYDKKTHKFGALGHPINDVDTGSLMVIDDGEILTSEIQNVQTGIKGTPGALMGNVDFDKTVGKIYKNTVTGIYGEGETEYFETLNPTEYPIGYSADIQKGIAYILANVDGNTIKKYEIKIDNISKLDLSTNKNFTITVTDKQLLSETGGIVQGMSGCPIIQNNKIIGAVTHVFVNNPTRGYGIFIENMLKNENNY